MSVTLRKEEAGDEKAISSLTKAAFLNMPESDGSEPIIVERLRSENDLALSLVASDGGELVGHIAFSPVTISDGTQDWFGLGPVSVAPDSQNQGIGSQLIRKGIATMQERGACGIVLLGSDTYYPRFGFAHDPELIYPGPPPNYFQRLVLTGQPPKGTVRYAPAFG